MDEFKQLLASAVTIAHPGSAATLFITANESSNAVGGVLSQTYNDVTSVFSKKRNLAQEKYSAFDRELLPIYKAIKNFRNDLEGRDFYILTDHKPFVSAIKNPLSDPPPRCFCHIDYILQFTNDIWCRKGADNVVADFSSHIGAVSSQIAFYNRPTQILLLLDQSSSL